MNLRDIQTPEFVIPHNPADKEIAERNAHNMEAWNRKYNKLPKQWNEWEHGNKFDMPTVLRGIGAI